MFLAHHYVNPRMEFRTINNNLERLRRAHESIVCHFRRIGGARTPEHAPLRLAALFL